MLPATPALVHRLVAGLTALLVILFGSFAGPTSAQDPGPPYASDWDAQRITELEQLFSSIECPQLTDATVADKAIVTTTFTTGRLADGTTIQLTRVVDRPSLQCNYLDNITNQQRWLQVQFDLEGTTSRYSCDAEPGDRTAQNVSLGRVVPDRAVAAQISAPGAPEPVLAELENQARAIAALVQASARGCPDEPVAVTCPTIAGFTAGEARIDSFSGAADTYAASCFYDPADPEAVPRVGIEFRVTWVPNGATTAARTASLCSTESSFDHGWGTVAGDGLAINAVYGITTVEPIDTQPVLDAIGTVMAQVAGQARSCEGVEFVPYSQLLTPLPPQFAAAFTPDHLDGPAPPLASEVEPVAAGALAPPPAATTAPIDGTSSPEVAIATDTAAPDLGSAEAPAPVVQPENTSQSGGLTGWLAVVLPIVTIVLLVISLIGLALAFLLIRRETRVRPRIDIARLVIVLLTATAMMLIFGKRAPLWAAGLAVAGGLALGYAQGNHLVVRLTEHGLMAKRTAWAIAAFAASLVLSQIAGLLNRTGAIALGIALSFLSAALTAGLIVGRRPRLVEARAATAAAVIVTLLVAPFGSDSFEADRAQAQDDGLSGTTDNLDFGAVLPADRTVAHNTLIDAVAWDTVEIGGGLWDIEGKPFTPAPVPRALDGLPAAVTRTVEWISSFGEAADADRLTVTETFTFRQRDDGWCCAVDYTATGVRTPVGRDPETWVVSGRLADIQSVAIEGNNSYNPSNRGGQPFTEALEFNAPGGGDEPTVCRRAVGGPRSSRLLDNGGGNENLAMTINGVVREAASASTVTFVIPCELPGISLQAALDAAPSPPARDDPVRQGCPVIQETVRALSAGTTLEGFDTTTLAEVMLTPNEPICKYGALIAPPAIGMGGRGNTRMEFMVDVAQPLQGEWDLGYTRWGARDNQVYAYGPLDVPERDRCQTQPDGTIIEPEPGRTCRWFSLHRIELPGPTGFRRLEQSSGWMQIWTDFNLSDGPNTSFSAAFPWAAYSVRCHHCRLDDPEIVDFLTRLNDFYGQGWGEFGGAPPQAPPASAGDSADDPLPAASTDPELDTTTPDIDTEAEIEAEVSGLLADDDEQTREAALVAILAVLAAAGLLGTSLAEIGLSMPDLVSAWRQGGRAAVEATVAARVEAHEMVFGADEDAGVGGDELYGGDPAAPRAPASPRVVIASPDTTVQAEAMPDGTVVFETIDADGNVIGTEVVDPETGEVVATTGTPYAASNWHSDRGTAARQAIEPSRSGDGDSADTGRPGSDGDVDAVGRDGAGDSSEAIADDSYDNDVANLLDQPNPDAHFGEVPNAPSVDPDSVRNPPAGPRSAEAAAAAARLGADGRGRVNDQFGNHIATIGDDGVPRNLDGHPVVVVQTEGAGVVGWSDGTRTIEYDTNGVPHEASRTWATDQTTSVSIWSDVTQDADGTIRNSENQIIGYETSDRSVLDIHDQPMDVRSENGRITQVNERVEVHDPRGQVVVERTPVTDAPRITAHRPSGLSAEVSARWSALGAGPNGEIYGTDGQVIGHIDTNGVVTTDGVVRSGVQTEGGRVVEASTEFGERISGDGTPMDPLRSGDGVPNRPEAPRSGDEGFSTPDSQLPEGVTRTEDGLRVDDQARVVADADLADLGSGRAPRHPDAPALPTDDARTGPAEQGAVPAADGPEMAGPIGDAADAAGTPVHADTNAAADGTTPIATPTTGDGTNVTATETTPTTDTGDTTHITATETTPTTATETVDGTRSTAGTTAVGFVDGRTRFDNFLGNRNIDRIGKLAQLTALTEQYEREGLSFEAAAERAAIETWGADVVADIVYGTQGVTAPGISMVGGAFLPPRMRGLMPDQMAAEVLRDGMRLGDAVMSDDPTAVDQAWETIRNDPNGSVVRGIAEASYEVGDYFADDTQASVTAQDLIDATSANLTQFGQDAQSGEYGTVLRGVAEMTSFAGELSAGDPATYDRLLRDFDTLWEHTNWQVSDNTVAAIQQTPIVGDVVTLAQNAPGFAASAQTAFTNWWNS